MRLVKQFPVRTDPPLRNDLAVLKAHLIYSLPAVGDLDGFPSFKGAVHDAVFGVEMGAGHPMQSDSRFPLNYIPVNPVKQLFSLVVQKFEGPAVSHLLAKHHKAGPEEVVRTLVTGIEIAAARPINTEVGGDGVVGEGGSWAVRCFQAVKRAFPTLNLDWLITGQGEMWEGPAPEKLKNLKSSDRSATNQELLLLNRLLMQKLEEVARRLKERDPEAYRELRLEELIRRGDA